MVLIGMKHCGKSTAARGLARRLGGESVDTDDVLADLYAAESGQRLSVREIFRTVGDAGFAALESRVCEQLLTDVDNAAAPRIIALGGRTAMREELQPLIKRLGRVVYLQADVDVLFERVMAGGLPPFLDAADPKGSFRQICNERAEVYERFADVVVDITGLAPEQVVDAITASCRPTE